MGNKEPSAIWTIYKAEVKALPRGRFALLGAALLLLGPLLFATTVWLGPRGLADASLFNMVMLPTILIPFGAARLAHARSSRFLQAVFTTPVSQSAYYFAQVLVVATLGLAYLVALLPFFAVHAFHLGWPLDAWTWMGIGLGMVVASAVLGCLVGVLFTSRGSLASLAVGVAFAVWTNAAWIMLPSAIHEPEGAQREVMLHLFGTSPAILLLGAAGQLPLYAVASPARSFFAFLAMVALAASAGWWAFARAQSAEAWGPSRRAAGLAAALVALALAAPVALASADYGEDLGRFSGQSWGSGGHNMTVELVLRGAPTTMYTSGPFGAAPLPVGGPVEGDLLVVLFPGPNQTGPLRALDLRVDGPRIHFEPSEIHLTNVTHFEEVPLPGPGGHGVRTLRIPVRATLEKPGNLTREMYPFNATATVLPEGASAPIGAEAGALVMGSVPGVGSQMLAAGVPFPLACLLGFGVRRWRMR